MRIEQYSRAPRHMGATERRIEFLLRGIVYIGMACVIGYVIQWLNL